MVEKDQVRKIQFTGKSSYIVSLPKEWIKDQGIKQGDQVSVVRQGSSVIEIKPINFGRRATQDAATLVITSKDDKHTITRKLIALYFLHYKTINVKPKNGRIDPNQRIAIRNTVKKILMGAEITADSTNEITIQVLINLVELSIDGAFKRMLHLSKSMQNDALLALRENNKELAQEVLNSDDDVDRFSFYIVNQFFKELTKYLFCFPDILDFENPMPEKIIVKIKEMSDFSLSVIDDTCLALFKNDYASAEKAIAESYNISKYEKRVIDLLKTVKNEETAFRVRRIVENIRRISEYASDIGEVVLNMNVEKLIQR